MQDQWFLDLDGVKSGPYQTSEVLSLVADGEVLPHHLIGTELKGKEWISMLDWRLAYGKSAAKTESAPKPPIPEKKPEPSVAPNPIIIEKEPESAPAPAEFVLKPDPVPPTHDLEMQEFVANGKRDPMAEMFDILQNTKHKREQKHHQEAAAHHQQQSNQLEAAPSSSSLSTTQFVLICVVITALGFSLGQLFQKHNAEQNAVSTTNKAVATTPTTAAPAAPGQSIRPVIQGNEVAPPPSKASVVDRSTDKMTIRTQLANPENPPKDRPAAPEKDQQMIEELKKELMELKALKEENRLNEMNDELPAENGQNPNPPTAEPNPPSGGAHPDQAHPDSAHSGEDRVNDQTNPELNQRKNDIDAHY
jgi:hypothetical protein